MKVKGGNGQSRQNPFGRKDLGASAAVCCHHPTVRLNRISPYRCFYPLAGLQAVVVAVSLAGADTARWHAREFLFGYLAAMLAGFVLTARPRWIGRPLAPQRPVRTLVVLWIAARLGSLPSVGAHLAERAWLSPVFCMALAGLVGGYLAAARNRRNLKVAMLLFLFAFGAVLDAVKFTDGRYAGLGVRIGLAAALGLIMVFGGRIIPSLTVAATAARDGTLNIASSSPLEAAAAVLAAAALGAWIVAPLAAPAALLCAVAALAQSLRLGQWHGLSVLACPSVFSLHVAYAFLPLGFALTSLAGLRPMIVSHDTGTHAWTVGAIGLMSLSVMTSMVRRRAGRPFAISSAAHAAYAFVGLSAFLRITAGVGVARFETVFIAASLSWAAAHAAFLVFLYEHRT